MADSRGELRAFIRSAMERGASDRFLADLLKSQGWSDRDVYRAFLEHYEEVTGETLPVRRSAGESAREAFYYLLAFSTLATWTIALGSLLFTLIERWIPDPLQSRGYSVLYSRISIATEIASLLVAFPVFLWVTRAINRMVALEPQKRYSGVRRWIIYLALLIAAGVLIGDFITVLAFFLRGELTGRFVSKALVVFLIGGGVFAYYLGEVRPEELSERDIGRRRRFAVAAALLVALAVTLGFLSTGSPETQRLRQADLRRVNDLQVIAHELHRTARGANQELTIPQNAAELRSRLAGAVQLRDPVTNISYEYHPVSGTAYRLCAVFATDTRAEYQRLRIPTFWAHPKERHCYELNAAQAPPGNHNVLR